MNHDRVLVGMSGGVDSGVCAYLLQKQGYSPVGVTMRLWSDTEQVTDEQCPSPDENARYAKQIADCLNIPHCTVGFGDTFRQTVAEPFIEEYAEGRTPNPCVNCNRTIKFGKMFDLSDTLHCSYLATGHYAKISADPSGTFLLQKAADPQKDQSYFLWSIRRELLPKLLFPLGEYRKSEIREIAEKAALPCAHRSDSQDICFIQNGDYISFIEQHSATCFPEGNFVAPDGSVLGRHRGIIRYTVGQRKGLGIALGQPAFVACKNRFNNTVTLCSDAELYRDTLTAHSLNFLVNDNGLHSFRAEAKIRYRHHPAAATVTRIDEDRVLVRFDTPQRAIAPGQSLALYDGNTLLGGGIIE